MQTTQQMRVTLPNEMADSVKSNAVSEESASENEVIREGLLALDACERAVEIWLREEVVPAYQALKADPSRGLSADEVRTNLARAHKKKTNKS